MISYFTVTSNNYNSQSCAHVTACDYHVAILALIAIEGMNIVELFTRAKRLQQTAAAKVGEEIEVITIDKSDSELKYEM